MQASKKFDEVPFIISGKLAQSYEKRIPPRINFKKSLSEVTEFIATLA
jgi:hypothetical protein